MWVLTTQNIFLWWTSRSSTFRFHKRREKFLKIRMTRSSSWGGGFVHAGSELSQLSFLGLYIPRVVNTCETDPSNTAANCRSQNNLICMSIVSRTVLQNFRNTRDEYRTQPVVILYYQNNLHPLPAFTHYVTKIHMNFIPLLSIFRSCSCFPEGFHIIFCFHSSFIPPMPSPHNIVSLTTQAHWYESFLIT